MLFTIGLLATITGIVAYFFLMYDVIYKRKTYALDMTWAIIQVISVLLWLIYNIMSKATEGVVFLAIILAIIILLIGCKYYYELNDTHERKKEC